jgi:fibronectin-binding autotransporter adhesin
VNPIDLNGGARTIDVADNASSTADYAVLAGALSDSVGGASFAKTGAGTLYLQGSTSNTYSGLTTIQGTLVAAKTDGAVAISGNIALSETGGGANAVLLLNGDHQLAAGCGMTFSTSTAASRLELNGHSVTLSAISGDSRAAIEGLYDNTGLNADSALTVDNSTNCTFSGAIRNSYQGSGAGEVSLVKSGSGTLVLGGTNTYTGATTVDGGVLQVNGSIYATSAVSVADGATLYFNRSLGYLGVRGPITGAGTVQIYQGSHGINAGTGGDTSLSGFAGTVKVMSGVAYVRSADGLGSGTTYVAGGAVYSLASSATTTYSSPIVLNGVGGTVDGVLKPALYGDGSGGAYTVSGPITLAATSDVGNSSNNSTLTLGGKITGAGGLYLGKMLPAPDNQYGTLAIAGTDSNDYSGTTTVCRGTTYLQKSGGAIAIPGNVYIYPSGTTSLGNTYLVLKASQQIAPTATMTFVSVRIMSEVFELQGHEQTLGGIIDTMGHGVIENSDQETGIDDTGTLTIDNAAKCTFVGTIRDSASGASASRLALVKSGSGTLTLTGGSCSDYTGGLTVNAGLLDYSGATTLPGVPASAASALATSASATTAPCPYTITGGTLLTGTQTPSIGAFAISGGTVSGGATLTSNVGYAVSGGRVAVNLAGNSVGLMKSGATVAVLTGANTYTGRTTIVGGTLVLGVNAQDCIVNLGGADIQSGALVFDYAGASSPAATIQSLLTASCDHGQWDVGQLQNTTAAASGLTLGWVDDASSSQVKVMATYAGDFNLDGVVNELDKAIWFANAFKGTTWQQGDANYDGVVNGLDRDLWFSHYGQSVLPTTTAPASVTPIPEPSTLALLSMALLGMVAYAWRRRK